MDEIYVLMDNVDDRERPVGVTRYKDKAEAFYQEDTRNRDVIMFIEEELPFMTGIPSTPPPPTPQPPKAMPDRSKERLQQAVDNIGQQSQKLEGILKRLNAPKRRK